MVMSKSARAAQADIQRLLKAMMAAGIAIGGVRLDPDGTIHAYTQSSNLVPGGSGWEDLE